MDIYCPISGCGEPVDMDYLHDVADDHDTNYATVLHDFQIRGCEAIDLTHSTGNDSLRADCMAAAFDLLGDDVDGAAAMMEDAAMLNMFGDF